MSLKARKYQSIILFFICSLRSFGQQAWTPFDIRGVDVRSGMEFDQRTRTIVIVSDGAIISSSDFGRTWEPKQNLYHVFFPAIWIVSKDTILFTYGDYIVFATDDGGKHVEPRISGLRQVRSSSLQHITGNPNRRNEVWLCEENIYKTTDAGRNWTLMFDAYSKLQSMSALAFHPISDSIMFVIKNGQRRPEVYQSTNSGVSWESIFPLYVGGGVGWMENKDILVTPSGSIYTGGLLSGDGGKIWNYAILEAKWYSSPFDRNKFVYNSKDDYIYAVNNENGMIRVKNGDSTYRVTKLGAKDPIFTESHRDARMITIDTLDGTIMTVVNDTFYMMRDTIVQTSQNAPYAVWIKEVLPVDPLGDTLLTATAKLIIRSTDHGRTWKEAAKMDGIYGKIFVQSPLNKKFIVTSYGFEITYSVNGGATFEGTVYCEANVGDLCFDPHDPRYLYGVGPRLWRVRDSTIINNIDHKVEFLDYQLPTPWLTGIAFNPLRQGVIFVCGYIGNENYLYRTTDYGQSWIELASGVFKETPWDIEIDPKNPARMYVWSDEGVFVSNDTGYTWRKSVAGMESKYIMHLIIDQEHPNILYASVRNALQIFGLPDEERRGGVYESTNYGESWRRLPDSGLWTWNINRIALAQNPRRLLIGTQCGAYEYILPPVTSIVEEKKPTSEEITLSQNYPNPFSDRTSITVTMNVKKRVRVRVCDMLGRFIHEILNDELEKGVHTFNYDRQNLPTGNYFCRLETANGIQQKVMTVY